MKRSSLTALWLSASAVLLSSCGGGGTTDESGSLTAFSIVPDEFTLSTPPAPAGSPPPTTCSQGTPVEVHIYGGTAPYRIDNTVPAYVDVSTTTVDSKGGSFFVTFKGPCLDPGEVVVVDHLDRTVTLKLHNIIGS
jgi:hypothetical protein